MLRFFTGDELGSIKLIGCSPDSEADTNDYKFNERVLDAPILRNAESSTGDVERAKRAAISHLAANSFMLAASRSDGRCSIYSLNEGDKLKPVQEWKDTRFSAGHKFIGLNLTEKEIFWCTSNGALGFSKIPISEEITENSPSYYRKASLPMRLCAWRLSEDSSTFAYGGNEVDLSVWDTEQALQMSASVSQKTNTDSKKRKRGDALFPGEIWRAKNLPNDSLNLRQPIHITSLTYIPTSPSYASGSKNVHIVTGTETGDVRRYDTRSARRPVANWGKVGKVGGIGIVEAGTREHELFVTDRGSNLSALDLRNGRTIYSYKKIQGSVTSLAPCSNGLLGSTSQDRFFRLHSTAPPTEIAGQQLEKRGEVLGKFYMKSNPTAVLFDAANSGFNITTSNLRKDSDDSDDVDEDVWDGIQGVDESDEENNTPKARRRS